MKKKDKEDLLKDFESNYLKIVISPDKLEEVKKLVIDIYDIAHENGYDKGYMAYHMEQL